MSTTNAIRFLRGAIMAASIFWLASCATVPKEVLSGDPGRYFTKDAELYLRVSGRTSRDLVESLGQERLDRIAYAMMKPDPSVRPEDFHVKRATLDQFLSRMSSVGVGISYEPGGRPLLEAAILGTYSGPSLPVALALNGDWRKEQGGYAHRSGELYLSNPTPGVLKLGTDRARSRLPDSGAEIRMLPSRYAQAVAPAPATGGAAPAPASGSATPAPTSGSTAPAVSRAQPDLAVWIRNPGRQLGAATFGEPLHIPVEGIYIAATRQTADEYIADITFQAKDEAQARTYRPIVRFLWVAAADRIFGSGTSSLYSLNLEADSFRVRGMVVSMSSLVQLIPLP